MRASLTVSWPQRVAFPTRPVGPSWLSPLRVSDRSPLDVRLSSSSPTSRRAVWAFASPGDRTLVVLIIIGHIAFVKSILFQPTLSYELIPYLGIVSASTAPPPHRPHRASRARAASLARASGRWGVMGPAEPSSAAAFIVCFRPECGTFIASIYRGLI